MSSTNSTQQAWSGLSRLMELSLIHTAHVWNAPEGALLSTILLIPLQQIPFLCRLAALVLVIPFALCIGLDVIAYAIARTLHLSMSQARIPRSPPSSKLASLPSERRQSDRRGSAAGPVDGSRPSSAYGLVGCEDTVVESSPTSSPSSEPSLKRRSSSSSGIKRIRRRRRSKLLDGDSGS